MIDKFTTYVLMWIIRNMKRTWQNLILFWPTGTWLKFCSR